MGRVSYRDTLDIEKAGLSSELNAALREIGCITIGDALNTPFKKLLRSKALLDMWDEYSDFVRNVHIARGCVNR